MTSLQTYQTELIDNALSAGALKFGSFTLKSGRISPYFFNAGLLCSGQLLSAIATAYASTIAGADFQFDIIFGPAYKGIAFAAVTALVLHREHERQVAYAYDRKEAKDHGEGGVMVGADVRGKRVLILDDVMTAGTAVRGSIDLIRRQGGQVVGVVMALDREEVGPSGNSTVKEVEELLGGTGTVLSILRMRDLIEWLDKTGRSDDVLRMKSYWDQYGVKK
ncbi:orotate phosphoribosyltransferase [Rickenella mellea]|uniref:orotate phosphoribosyltransferase n=1 Tax=Rickenella mellea TaxID=50990 RepID=A0A4Y7Q335_9AGAM|nr:orotate phosphoribosyltransferase [Rickenella mellea]